MAPRPRPRTQVDLLGAALGRSLVFEPMTDDEVREQQGDYGEAAIEIFRDHASLESEIQPTVQRLLGRPSGSLDHWLDRHRGLLRPITVNPGRALS